MNGPADYSKTGPHYSEIAMYDALGDLLRVDFYSFNTKLFKDFAGYHLATEALVSYDEGTAFERAAALYTDGDNNAPDYAKYTVGDNNAPDYATGTQTLTP